MHKYTITQHDLPPTCWDNAYHAPTTCGHCDPHVYTTPQRILDELAWRPQPSVHSRRAHHAWINH